MKTKANTKALTTVGGALLLFACSASAQEFRASATPANPQPKFQQQTGSFDLKLKTTGVIPRIIQSDSKLQMINPNAREEFGDGKALVAKDPAAKQPVGADGITVFGIEF